jgi:hypothetical protein
MTEKTGWTLPEWQRSYQEAFLEFDKTVLRVKLLRAEDAIGARLRQLQNSSDSHAEKAAIETALSVLRCLRRDKFDYPARRFSSEAT